MMKKSEVDNIQEKEASQALVEFSKLRTWFYYEELEPGTQKSSVNLPKNVLAIILEGETLISCNEFVDIKVSKGYMAFYRSHSLVKYTILRPLKMLYMAFDILLSEYDMLAMWSYRILENYKEPQFPMLEVKGDLQYFIKSSLHWFKDRKMPMEFHEIKHKELLFILRTTYSKDELSYLFQPLLSKTVYFREFILSKWSPSMSLDEIVKLSLLSKATFIRRFKEEFKSTPHQWRLSQNSQRLRHKASEPGVRVKDLMNEIGITEQSHFNKFCRKHFNCTPKEFIHKYQRDSPLNDI